ncbi:MAG: EAL domain-containing protein [Eubacteriales bacterium]
MKKAKSLKTKMVIVMLILLILQSVSILSVMVFSDALTMLDSYAFRFFEGTTSEQIKKCNDNIGVLIDNVADKSGRISKGVLEDFQDESVSAEGRYNAAMLKASQHLVDLLHYNNVTGAFLVMDKDLLEEISGQEIYSNPSIYFRVSDGDVHDFDYNKVFMYAGPTTVLRHYGFSGNISLNRQYLTSDRIGDKDFYKKPMEAVEKYPVAELKRYGYWSEPTKIIPNTVKVVTYTLPLVDGNGKPFGVVGVDATTNVFAREYLFTDNLPYENSFYIAAKMKGAKILTNWVIAQTPLGAQKVSTSEFLEVKKGIYKNIYKTKLQGGENIFCNFGKLGMYNVNSPYAEENWTVIGFVKEDVLRSDSLKVRNVLATGVIVIAISSLIVVILLSEMATRKIKFLEAEIEQISSDAPVELNSIGILEIDQLIEKVKIFSDEVLQAHGLTSTLLDISLLPVGVYEIKNDFDVVVATPYIAKLLKFEGKKTHITKHEWAEKITMLTQKPFPKEHDNIYEYYDRRYGQMYLRIREKETKISRLGVIADVTKEIGEEVRLNMLLDHDNLTGLYNRRAIENKASAMIRSDPDSIGALIFVDLDNLKYVNDTYGHEIGDVLIKEASVIFAGFKDNGAIVSRISGDEFAIFMTGFKDKSEIQKILSDRIIDADLQFITVQGDKKIAIRYSTGVSYYPQDATNIKELLKFADFAMYEAKKTEKGSLCEFDNKKYFEQKYLLENRENINTLLLYEQIRFAFQPIVDMQTGDVAAFEALMRPSTPNFKNPLEIISVAKMQAKLKNLERMIFRLAFKTIYENMDKIGNRKIFVNSIPQHMISLDEVMELLDKYPIDLSQIVVEVTESEADMLNILCDKLEEFKEAGIKLAIDDYGSGYSSEVRMLKISPEVIKMDINLISNIDKDDRKKKLVSDLIAFCVPNKIKVLAEGIETAQELEELLKYEIDLGQGYYFAKPDFEFRTELEAKKEILKLRG